MKKLGTSTLLIAGISFWMASALFMTGTVMLRPIYGPNGDFLRRPDGSRIFEHDILAQLRHDWVSYLMMAVGTFCLAWSVVRGLVFLYARVQKKNA
jgi:hypothetical protein